MVSALSTPVPEVSGTDSTAGSTVAGSRDSSVLDEADPVESGGVVDSGGACMVDTGCAPDGSDAGDAEDAGLGEVSVEGVGTVNQGSEPGSGADGQAKTKPEPATTRPATPIAIPINTRFMTATPTIGRLRSPSRLPPV